MSENKKGLLNENTIRRFMKLAEIDTLSDQFVDSLTEKYGHEEEVEEGMGMYKRDEKEDELEEAAHEEDEPAFDMAAEADAEDVEADLPPEPEVDAPAAAAGPVDAEAIFTSLAQALAGVAEQHGVAMDIEGGGEEAAPEMAPEPAEDDLDMAAEPMEEAAHEEDELEEGAHEEDELEEGVDEDAMVAEITRRVADRLQQESRNEKIADQLAERIVNRLKTSS